jgi:RNA polymerase sigma-70 factor (ECF subfamily)
VGSQILPHEGAVRAWLRRSQVPADEIDDLIQEAYCNLCDLDTVDHIPQPAAYFFRTVRNLLTDRLRRARIVRIETVAEVDAFPGYTEELSPERIITARNELDRVRRLIRALPGRCRQVIELRKVHGLSQREIGRRLNISESVVENEGVKGMRLLLLALQADGMDGKSDRVQVKDGKARHRDRN